MRGWVCTSISFNFCTWYRVEIRFSDNPRQKETTDDIIWVSINKRVIYRLGIIFSITHVVQLMVSKINLFCQRNTHRYPWSDIRRKIPNFIPCQEVEKWQWHGWFDTWYLVEVLEEIAVYAYGNASNFKLEEWRCFLGNSIRFSDSFFYYAVILWKVN